MTSIPCLYANVRCANVRYAYVIYANVRYAMLCYDIPRAGAGAGLEEEKGWSRSRVKEAGGGLEKEQELDVLP